MHESGIINELVEKIKEKCKGEAKDAVVGKIKLQVSSLSHLTADSLQLHYDLLVKDDLQLNKAKIEVFTYPGKAICKECTMEFNVEDMIVNCPKCGSLNLDTGNTEEIRVESVEIL